MKRNNKIRNVVKTLGTIGIVIGLTIFISSCSLFSSGSDSEAQDFPNKIGNSWTYQFTDNNSDSVGTLSVEIIGEDTLPDGRKAKQWEFTYPNDRIDSMLVVSNDSMVIFYSLAHETLNEEFKYIFPLQLANSWDGEIINSEYVVLEKGNVSVPAGSYSGTYTLTKTIPPSFNFFEYDTLWYKEEIGILKNIQHRYDLGPVSHTTWELVSYNFK